MAGRNGKSCGLPASDRRGMESRNKLVQPPMGAARLPGHQVSKLGSGGDCHRPLLAQKTVVRAPRSDVDRVRRHAPQQRPLLTAEASGTSGGRAFRVERRGLPTATPPWMLLKSRQLHDGAHLPPVVTANSLTHRRSTINRRDNERTC